jgi:DNA-binding IclR family transcriptional regulator
VTDAAQREPGGPRSRRSARGLDRAVEIFQLLHAVRKPISIGEIARRLKAPRSTIYEIVNLFLAADILEYSGDGSEVFFGRAIYLYANDYHLAHAMVRLGQEEVRRLAIETGETCQFCMPVGNKYTVVRCRTARGCSVSAPTSACWCRSLDRLGALLRRPYEPRRAQGIHPARGLPASRTAGASTRKFLAEASGARGRHLCNPRPVDEYATCVAAPVVDHAGARRLASASSSRAPRREAHGRTLRVLLDSARRLSAVPETGSSGA